MTPRERLNDMSGWQKVLTGLGSAAGAVAVVWMLTPLIQRASPQSAATSGAAQDASATSMSIFEAKLSAHTRETENGQQEIVGLLLEGLALSREINDQLKVGNALARQRLNFDKCLATAKNDEARRICAQAR